MIFTGWRQAPPHPAKNAGRDKACRRLRREPIILSAYYQYMKSRAANKWRSPVPYRPFEIYKIFSVSFVDLPCFVDFQNYLQNPSNADVLGVSSTWEFCRLNFSYTEVTENFLKGRKEVQQ